MTEDANTRNQEVALADRTVYEDALHFALKLEYQGDVHVDLLLKHIDNSGRLYKAGVDKIDYHIPEQHTRADLEAMLGAPSGGHL